MRCVATSLVLAVVVAGCAHDWRPLDVADVRQRKPATLLLVLDPNDAFMAADPDPVYDPFDSATARIIRDAARGSSILRDNEVVDPALRIGDAFARALAKEYALDLVVVEEEPEQAVTPVRRLPRAGADLILEVKTTRWALVGAPGQRHRFAVSYRMEVKLTDTRDGQLLALGECVGDDPSIVKASKLDRFRAAELTARAPRYREMLANRAELLKGHLAAAASRCERAYQSKLFFISSDESQTPGD